jgi:hypothetical protein
MTHLPPGTIAAGYLAQVKADAAAAERDRIRQLATEHNAKYIPTCGPHCPCPGDHQITAPFTDLLTGPEGDTP